MIAEISSLQFRNCASFELKEAVVSKGNLAVTKTSYCMLIKNGGRWMDATVMAVLSEPKHFLIKRRVTSNTKGFFGFVESLVKHRSTSHGLSQGSDTYPVSPAPVLM